MRPHELEPARDEMLTMGRAVLDVLADFVEDLPSAPSSAVGTLDDLLPELLEPPGEEPGDFGDLLKLLQQAMSKAVETAGPSYLAYIPGGGLFTSALAELMTRVYNRYTGVSALGPGPVAMEQGVMSWLCREFDMPEGAVGVVSTGGSLATLSALVAARERMLGEDFSDGTVYVTAHTHLCVAKAARVIGLPPARVRVVPTTRDHHMDPEAAARMVAEDRAAGLRPAVLVGTAGTTDSGSIDDLERLAALARAENLWFHVDGAYGGFFRLTTRGRARLRGIERADSVVLDPHKGLFLPFGTGVLLVRDRTALQGAFGSDASYLQDLDVTETLPDYNNLAPELTREARGPRLWLPLHLHGVAAFRDALDEKLDLAEAAYRDLSADPRIETDGPPSLTVVTFRLRDGGETEHRQWLDRINASRRVHLSSTRLGGRFTLRLCVLSHRTHLDRVQEAVEVVRASVPGSRTSPV